MAGDMHSCSVPLMTALTRQRGEGSLRLDFCRKLALSLLDRAGQHTCKMAQSTQITLRSTARASYVPSSARRAAAFILLCTGSACRMNPLMPAWHHIWIRTDNCALPRVDTLSSCVEAFAC